MESDLSEAPPRRLWKKALVVLSAAGLALVFLATARVRGIALAAGPAHALAEKSTAEATSTVVCGSVVHKGWGKTLESWDAGGGDYFTISMDRAYAAQLPSFLGSIILRPSADHPDVADAFTRWAGKHSCVRGVLATAKPYKPAHDWEQFPVDGDGKPSPRGSGIVVDKIGARLTDVQ